jgi:hypothetical protein
MLNIVLSAPYGIPVAVIFILFFAFFALLYYGVNLRVPSIGIVWGLFSMTAAFFLYLAAISIGLIVVPFDPVYAIWVLLALTAASVAAMVLILPRPALPPIFDQGWFRWPSEEVRG